MGIRTKSNRSQWFETLSQSQMRCTWRLSWAGYWFRSLRNIWTSGIARNDKDVTCIRSQKRFDSRRWGCGQRIPIWRHWLWSDYWLIKKLDRMRRKAWQGMPHSKIHVWNSTGWYNLGCCYNEQYLRVGHKTIRRRPTPAILHLVGEVHHYCHCRWWHGSHIKLENNSAKLQGEDD